MTTERIHERRAAALANIARIEADPSSVRGHWLTRQQCIETNRRMVASCDDALRASREA